MRRQSAIANRFKKMAGLPASEKQTLVRIGEVVDGLINNRGPTNPGADSNYAPTKIDRSIPPPTNLSVGLTPRSARIFWDPVDSSKLNYYKVTIINLDTGETTTAPAYSNTYTIRGTTGNFRVIVQTVGRQRKISSGGEITFEIPRNAIQFVGSKNDPTGSSSNIVSQSVFVQTGYQVFGWVSFTLDTFWDFLANPNVQVEIYVGPVLATATLLETLTLTEEEMLVSNLPKPPNAFSAAARTDEASRSDTFQTSLASAFGPYDAEVPVYPGTSNRFWAKVIGRDTVVDVYNLSISLFAVSGALASLTATVTEVNNRAITILGCMRNATSSTIGIANQWTIAIWAKKEKTAVDLGNTTLFTLQGLPTAQQVQIQTQTTPGGPFTVRDNIRVALNNAVGPIREYLWTFVGFPPEGPWPALDTSYYHLVVVWDGTLSENNKLQLYLNGALLTPTAMLTNTAGAAMADAARNVGLGVTVATVAHGACTDANQWNGKVFSAAIWNSPLDSIEVQSITNAGDPTAVDLRVPFLGYLSSDNLMHWWRPGFDITSAATMLADYGSATTLLNLTDSIGSIDPTQASTDIPQEVPSVHQSSINFNADVLLFGTNTDIGIANTWTISIWAKTEVNTLTRNLFNLKNSGSNNDQILIRRDPAGTNRVNIQIFNSTGSTIKNYGYTNGIAIVDEWVNLTFTWDGTNLLFYRNGTLTAADVLTTDVAGTMSTTTRQIAVGSNISNANGWDGSVYSVAIWDTILDSLAITSIYNSGNAPAVNLLNNFSDYVSSTDLLHWWRCGYDYFPIADYGVDYGTYTNLPNIMDDSSGIDNGSRIPDYPT